ncbi:MAG: hypothetical protein JO165_03145, partial [Candidatus Eremiobacteraeota bacterium]|nr:hypothetical protein [Candidatus Eremiobacteraeota bacterium]
MRRRYAALALCLSIGVVGAARPTPRPTATPTPKATALPLPVPTAAPAPIVIVYPFGTSSGLKAGTGLETAQFFVQQIGLAGGINAITGDPKVSRADYLNDSKKRQADYYVAGYMTLVGDGVSLVEQIVSTQSGTVVDGRTALIQSIADAASQASTIHDTIIARENAFATAIASSNAPAATPTPMGGNEANLTGVASDIANVFKHKGKTSAVAQATPVPDAQKPSKGVYVARVSGSAAAGELSTATTALFQTLNNKFRVQMSSASGNIAPQADRICGTQRNNT